MVCWLLGTLGCLEAWVICWVFCRLGHAVWYLHYAVVCSVMSCLWYTCKYCHSKGVGGGGGAGKRFNIFILAAFWGTVLAAF